MVRRLFLPRRHCPWLEPLSFQDLILTLHDYWGDQGCAILQPYDIEVGAGTLHPATVLRALGPQAVEGRLCPALRAAPATAAMARTPTGCSTTTSTR